jgi:glutamyl-tRNA synthetase
MNGEYIKKLSPEEFHKAALPYYKSIEGKGLNLVKISELLQGRVSILREIPDHIDFFMELPDYGVELYIHKKMKTTYENSLMSLQSILPVLEAFSDWNNDALYNVMTALVEKMGIKNGQLLWPVRTALSGKASSPGGASELAELLGKDESIKRIKIGIEKLQNS